MTDQPAGRGRVTQQCNGVASRHGPWPPAGHQARSVPKILLGGILRRARGNYAPK